MPNWCNTTYKCVGDLKEVNSLHKILKYIDKRKTTILKNGFGKWWLGNLVHKLGGDWKKYSCRGEIIDYSLDENVLTINQATAWCEQEGVRQIIEEKFPSIKVYFVEEEPGCELYRTNDVAGRVFSERFCLNYDGCLAYFETIERAADYVSSIVGYTVGANVKSISNALESHVKAHNLDVFYEFNEFDVE